MKYIDYKLTVWRRITIYDDLISDEDIIKNIEENCGSINNLAELDGNLSDEIVYESEEEILPIENEGMPTIEFFPDLRKDSIWDNVNGAKKIKN